jgi:hypothetical protein
MIKGKSAIKRPDPTMLPVNFSQEMSTLSACIPIIMNQYGPAKLGLLQKFPHIEEIICNKIANNCSVYVTK